MQERQTPNSKLQAPEKLQAPSTNGRSLVLLWMLELYGRSIFPREIPFPGKNQLPGSVAVHGAAALELEMAGRAPGKADGSLGLDPTMTGFDRVKHLTEESEAIVQWVFARQRKFNVVGLRGVADVRVLHTQVHTDVNEILAGEQTERVILARVAKF